MSWLDFYNTYNGKQIDLDGYPKEQPFQCYDLANKWSMESGYQRFVGLYAHEIFGQQPQNYTWVRNSPTGVPPAGSVVVWGAGINNGPGHVAVATGQGDTSSFVSLDQNWGVPRCIPVRHNYNHVIGWGIPRNATGDTTMAIGSGENWYARLNQLHVQLLGVEFPRKDFPAWVGQDILHFVEAVSDNPAANARANIATVALRDNWEGQINTLSAQVKEQGKAIQDLQAKLSIQSDDTKLLNSAGELLQKLIIRFGLKK